MELEAERVQGGAAEGRQGVGPVEGAAGAGGDGFGGAELGAGQTGHVLGGQVGQQQLTAISIGLRGVRAGGLAQLRRPSGSW